MHDILDILGFFDFRGFFMDSGSQESRTGLTTFSMKEQKRKIIAFTYKKISVLWSH